MQSSVLMHSKLICILLSQEAFICTLDVQEKKMWQKIKLVMLSHTFVTVC